MNDQLPEKKAQGKAGEKAEARLAVVLFNLGGPDSLEAVEPFLKNLFLDPAILPVPGPVRKVLARRISKKRAPVTQEIYRQLGGKTPLLELTRAQATNLEKTLNSGVLSPIFRKIEVFVAMRYWHPRAAEVVAEVKAFEPSQVVLVPLYPQYSTTTSQTSIDEWKREAVRQKLIVATRAQCCYPVEENFVAAHVALIREALKKVPQGVRPRILFSAHGLPVQIIEGGDPYQSQIEMTVAAVMKRLGSEGLDHGICYQSRVTKHEWLGPSTDDEIDRAGRDGVGVILTPIAFVSEHSETLVELDVEYRALAEKAGVACYIRVPALGEHEDFIRSLQSVVEGLAVPQDDFATRGPQGARICAPGFSRCPCKNGQPVESKEGLSNG